MGKAWEEVAPQIWDFFQNGVQVKMIRVGEVEKDGIIPLLFGNGNQSTLSLARSFHLQNCN